MQQFYCKPQVFGPTLALLGEILPPATGGIAYTQDIHLQASGGVPPYTFSLISSTPPPDNWFVSAIGVITGTPWPQGLLTAETGADLLTETGLFIST